MYFKTNDQRKYIPVSLRQDIVFPRFLDNIYGTPLSDSSQDSDYYKVEEENIFKFNAKYKRRGGIFNYEQLGIDQEQLQQLQNENKKNQSSKIMKSHEDSLKSNISDFTLDSKIPKKIKPKKKFDEDVIHSYTDEKLKEFIEYKFIDEYINEKKEEVRKIIIMFKHPNLVINAMTVKEFFLPVYKEIKDKKDALKEFEDWRDYALKYIFVRGNSGDFVHLSNGIRVEHFGQIPKQHNILIFGPSRILSFWHEFQKYYSFQLTFDQQKDFVYDLNCCKTKQEVYSQLISLTQIQSTLLKREKQRMIKREEIKLINQEKLKNMYHYNSRRKTQSQSSIYQLEDDFKFLKFKKLSINTYVEDQQSKDYLLERQLQTEKRLKQIEFKVDDQISKSCKNIFRKQKFQFSNRVKPYTTLDQPRKKPNQLKNFQITFSKLPEIKKSQTIPNLKVQNSKKLIDLYSHYTGVLRTHVLSDKSKKSFNFGSIMKSFNGVRMKIMQQSLPRVAQIKKYTNQSQIVDSSIISKTNHRYNEGKTIGWNQSRININGMADFSINRNK